MNNLKIKIIGLLVFFCVLFSSCSVVSNPPLSQNDKSITNKATNENINIITTDTINHFKDMGMLLATSPWGLLQRETVVNDKIYVIENCLLNGCFFRVLDTQMYKEYNLGYKDFPVIDDILGGAAPINVNNHLLVIKTGTTPIPHMDWSGYESIIYLQDQNSSFLPICKLNSNQVFDTGIIAADCNNNMYFIIQEYDTETASSIEKTLLLKLNIDTYELETLYEWGPWTQVAIMGIYPEGLVLLTHDRINTGSGVKMTVALYSLSDNNLNPTLLDWVQGEFTTALDMEGHIFYSKGSSLYMYDLSSSQSILVYDDLSGESENSIIILRGEVFDGYIPYLIYTPDGNEYHYAFDIANRRIIKNELLYQFQGDDIRTVEVVGAVNDYYAAVSGLSIMHEEYKTSEGVYSYDRGYVQYSLIAKQDYWNNMPIFISFE